jgi:DNA replication and repair protein RecF
MHITQLRLDHFRNLSEAMISPSDSVNLIYGNNGAGKSSLLEAIHVLAFGRSFRTSRPNSIIQTDFDAATTFCRFKLDDTTSVLGANRSKENGFVFNIDGKRTRRISDIARILPVQIFTPQSSDLVIGAPMLRRRFIDWLVFHVEHDFYRDSNSYANALVQRNALLKLCTVKGKVAFQEQDMWSPIMASHGEIVTRLRKKYLNALEGELKDLYREFRPDVKVELRYNQGWDSSVGLSDALAEKRDRDLFRGATSVGPHKADIHFMINGQPAAEFLSRGQLRVLVSLLLIAEVRVLRTQSNKSCIFLVDDIAAELDTATREYFLDTIVAEGTQVFVTAIEKHQLAFVEKYKNKKVFHVKHNHVHEE